MTNENRTYNKEQWARGEWDNEPDRVDFIHAGFSCFILRNDSGNWCGYVGIPKEHPLYGVAYGEWDTMPNFDVHGGLTYSNHCRGCICHHPEQDMPDDVWWFGFDTGHSGDLSPLLKKHSPFLFEHGETYKNMAYVIAETKKLAEQLRAERANDTTDKE